MHALYTTLLDAHCILQFATCNAHATSKRAGKTKRGLQTLLARFFATPSLHHSVHFINAPIFRLLLKVAVKGTHQCDLSNFCGGSWPPTFVQKKRCRPEGFRTLSLKPSPSLWMSGAHAVHECACSCCRPAPTNVTQKGVLRLAKCKASATREGL